MIRRERYRRGSRGVHLGHDDPGFCWYRLHGLSTLAQKHDGTHGSLIKTHIANTRPPSGGLFVWLSAIVKMDALPSERPSQRMTGLPSMTVMHVPQWP